ncbi:hypothetical protein D3C84_514000 [compost metagenome]
MSAERDSIRLISALPAATAAPIMASRRQSGVSTGISTVTDRAAFGFAPLSFGIAQAVMALKRNNCGAGVDTWVFSSPIAWTFLPLCVLYLATRAFQCRGDRPWCKRADTQQSAWVRSILSAPHPRNKLARSPPSPSPVESYNFCQACLLVLSIASAARADTTALDTLE